MNTLLAITAGILVAAGLYSLFQRSLVKVVIGVMLLGQAANLIILASAGLRSTMPAIIGDGATTLGNNTADPLPQAIVLTAIVIGFGFTAFILALIHRAHKTLETSDIEALNKTDKPY